MTPAVKGREAPAAIRRALLVLLAFPAAAALAGPSNLIAPPDFGPVGQGDGGQSGALLERFRDSGPAEPYYLEFQLQTIPRRGDVRITRGRLWGAREGGGLVLRLCVWDAAGGEHRFLLRNGPEPAGWSFSAGAVVPLAYGDMSKPLVEGVEVTPFDMQMPYLYWPDVRAGKVTRVLGRPARQFVFSPPRGPSGGASGPAGVRAYFDTEFNEPVQTELLASDGSVTTTLSLVDLKRVGKQWIPREVDVRDESTRDKTRIFVTAAALGLDLSPALFLPEELAVEVAPPEGRLIARFHD